MPDQDLDEILAVARRLLRQRRLKSLREAMLPITAHVGSLLTIFGIWFMRAGSFSFQPENWADWLVALVLATIAVSGVKVVVSGLSAPSRLVVTRSELVALITAARDEAETSIINMAGDLSWLREDLPITKALRSRKPDVAMTVLYDRSRTPEALGPLLNEYERLNVRLIAYPDGFTPALRGMLLDRNAPQARRFYVFSRLASPTLGLPRDRQPFVWQEFDHRDAPTLNAVTSLLSVLLHLPTTPIFVGVSGSNNVGKTTIVRRARELLQDRFRVEVFGDEFRLSANGTSFEDACATLCAQLAKFPAVSSEVCIFDRTFADNLCFVRLRGAKNEKLYRAVAKPVAEILRRFDLMVDVHRAHEDYSKATTYVSGEDRKRIRRYLDEFLQTADIQTLKVTTDDTDFRGSVDHAARTIADAVVSIESRR